MGVILIIQGQGLNTTNAETTTEIRGSKKSDRIATPRSTLKGECPELEGTYFYFSTNYRAYIYKTSISNMSRYVARKYNNRDNIKMIHNELNMPTLDKPKALGSMRDNVDKDIYK